MKCVLLASSRFRPRPHIHGYFYQRSLFHAVFAFSSTQTDFFMSLKLELLGNSLQVEDFQKNPLLFPCIRETRGFLVCPFCDKTTFMCNVL